MSSYQTTGSSTDCVVAVRLDVSTLWLGQPDHFSVVVERAMLLTLEMVGFGVVTELQEYRCSLVKAISPYQCWGKV